MHCSLLLATRPVRTALPAVLALALLLLTGAPAVAADGTGIPWIKDLDRGLDEARKSGKPIFVDAWARWCHACYQMDDMTYAAEPVIAAMQDFVPVKLDMDLYENFSRKHQVSALPTALFLDAEGRELTRMRGLIGPDQLRQGMGAVLEEYAAYRSARNQKGDPEALHSIAKQLLRMGNVQGAIDSLEEALAGMDEAPAKRRDPIAIMLADLELATGLVRISEARYAGLSTSPDSEIKGRALAGLFFSRRAQGKSKEAEEALEALRQEFPEIAQEIGGS
ncbi:hypothetical protein ABI59_10085 [Acidobacteria bacterium Mor1]|nr:hypothetical protein ABI59_10085 [Acidobacteria bacterium Mor1]